MHELFFQINKSRGTTIVVVTHNPSFAERMPRVIHLLDGLVEKDVRRGKDENATASASQY
jgi:ABC-type lipoprotein export system ATPase subunit